MMKQAIKFLIYFGTIYFSFSKLSSIDLKEDNLEFYEKNSVDNLKQILLKKFNFDQNELNILLIYFYYFIHLNFVACIKHYYEEHIRKYGIVCELVKSIPFCKLSEKEICIITIKIKCINESISKILEIIEDLDVSLKKNIILNFVIKSYVLENIKSIEVKSEEDLIKLLKYLCSIYEEIYLHYMEIYKYVPETIEIDGKFYYLKHPKTFEKLFEHLNLNFKKGDR